MADEDAATQRFRREFGITGHEPGITHDGQGFYKEAPAAAFTVAELHRVLQAMPGDVTVFFADSQNGDRAVRAVTEETNYSGARVVVLREAAG
jgi:hypothetical protein